MLGCVIEPHDRNIVGNFRRPGSQSRDRSVRTHVDSRSNSVSVAPKSSASATTPHDVLKPSRLQLAFSAISRNWPVDHNQAATPERCAHASPMQRPVARTESPHADRSAGRAATKGALFPGASSVKSKNIAGCRPTTSQWADPVRSAASRPCGRAAPPRDFPETGRHRTTSSTHQLTR